MVVGLIGLGKMGMPMAQRLVKAGHEVHVYDRSLELLETAVGFGAQKALGVSELVTALGSKPVVWLMIPANAVDAQLQELAGVLPEGSIVIDGGNSDYRKTVARAEEAAKHGVAWIDIGTSGGILGGDSGYAMMVGGKQPAVQTIWPLVEALGAPEGFLHVGPPGSGHYVKMVHNAIEYGMMQSYAEGYRLLKEGPFTQLDLGAIGNSWQHGSIVASLLNQLTAEALTENPQLEGIDGYVAESGEARWALEASREYKVDMPAIQASLDVRIASQAGRVSFTTKLLAAMRNKFGGHSINK